jgi:beta-glucosidase
MSLAQARYDSDRVHYYEGYLNQILEIVNVDKINLIGAIGWSMLDNLEWGQGFKSRFGFQYVDYKTMKRYYKKSAFYFRDFFTHYVEK